MLKGGVIMDVVTPEQARIAEDAGASAVMALERVPADIRAQGGVARMSDPELIEGIVEAVDIPVLHLADVVAAAVKESGIETVGLIGTKVAMSESFFVDRLASHGLSVIVPDAAHHDFLNDAIYEELVHGVVLPRTRNAVVGIIEELWDAGAGGVLLGCTELELLVKQAYVELPVFPCTTLHVQAALDLALG